ncbi:hypothetical protein C5167_003014 [Papaver somniferum]|uniref:Uncharacterized protein n=1 Tax=Papaver somniferum TaxID=3469 RepID=A0A4Y7L1E2_PAPSO|nr:hypothetical protein C5167_003014 [Papaver somniferum]
MSGAGKKVADLAAKAAASKGIDWDGMAKLLVSEEARKEFSSLRRAFDEVNSTLQTRFSQSSSFRRYNLTFSNTSSSKLIASSEALLCIQVPKYVDNVTPQFKPKFESLLIELKEAEQKSLQETERLEKEIAEVQELKKKISTMTANEYFEKHPELKKKFDDEIRNDYWGY